MPLTPLSGLCAILAGAFFSSCSLTSPSIPAATRPAYAGTTRRSKAVRQIPGQLAARRTSFLASGNLREVFSVFSFHVTAAILQRVKNGTVSEPDLILEMVEDFYEDYDRNRSPALCEAHWQPYYALAATAPSPDFKTGRKLIQLGSEAHIDHDLPRLLTRLFQRHPEVRGERLLRLQAALESLNALFLPCSILGFQDLAKVLPSAPGPRAIVFQSRIARAIITRKRQRAWNRATEGLR